MRYITKGREPSSLTQYKKQSGAYFDGVNKEDIRQALLEEQGVSLCILYAPYFSREYED